MNLGLFLFNSCFTYIGLPCILYQIVKNLVAMQGLQFRSLGQEDPLEKEWLPTPVFLPGEFPGQRNPWGCKELDMNE